MPREFTDSERERIRRQIREAGRELFAARGLAKTTITDLTDPAGVSDSTFYAFYDAKEALYLELLEEQREAVAGRATRALERHDDPERAIAAFLRAVTDGIESEALVRRLIVGEEPNRLRDRSTEEGLDQQAPVGGLLSHVEAWYEAGDLRGPDPGTVAHAVRAVTLLALHKEDVGAERYPAVRDLVIDAVAAGLTRTDAG